MRELKRNKQEFSESVFREFWEGSKQIFENHGALDYPNLELMVRDRRVGLINTFRQPIESADCRKPKFVLNNDVLFSIRKEFHDILGLSDPESVDEMLVDYSAASAIGERLFRNSMVDIERPRTPREMRRFKDILIDNNDMVEFFAENIDDPHKAESGQFLARFMPDETLMRINAIRSGISMYRSLGGTGLTGSLIAEDASEACKLALIDYATSSTPAYEELAKIAIGSASKGTKASTYFIPEWLFVSAFPMSSEKVDDLKI